MGPIGNVGTYLYDSYTHRSSNRESLRGTKMARRNDNPHFPVAGQNVYKFDKDLDAQVRGQMAPQLGADPSGGVVREGAFRARRDAQVNKRRKAGY